MKPKKKLYQQEMQKIAIFWAVFEGVPGVHSRVKYPYLVDLDVIYKISTINSRVDAGNTFKNGPQNRYFLTFSFFELFLQKIPKMSKNCKNDEKNERFLGHFPLLKSIFMKKMAQNRTCRVQ